MSTVELIVNENPHQQALRRRATFWRALRTLAGKPAIKYSQYGPPDVLELVELEKPAPKSTELLVKVLAVSINYGDMIARNFKNISSREFNMPFLFWFLARIAFGLNAPRNGVLGSEFAGEVEAVGGSVKTFKAGDPVFGYRGQSMGANAEYLCVPENSMVTAKPANMTYDEAATVPYGALTALNLLRKVKIQPGQKVLINGASGSIGAAAVQLAKHFGATVTGVCSTPRLAYVKSLGADKVIDYTREDFTRSCETYDLIFDVLGRSSFEKCESSLNENGHYLLASFKGRQLLQMLLTRNSIKKVICALSGETLDDLLFIKTLIESSELKTIIDRRFPLDKTADAHRYLEAGEKRGCVIITMG